MKPRTTIASATSPDGTALDLIQHAGAYIINADGLLLMSTKMVHSEEELARIGCDRLPANGRALIGGLGCGYTLRATLDRLPEGGRAIQVELVPEIVQWNREGPLGPFADHPLEDPRTDLIVEDVSKVIRKESGSLDAIMLDVDNGPSAIVTNTNAWLYSNAGLQAIRRALSDNGRVAIWSAEADPGFQDKLRRNGFEPGRHRVWSRPNKKGPVYYIYVGDKRPS